MVKAFDHRENRVMDAAAAPASDRGGVGRAFDRLDREGVLLHELIEAVETKLEPVLRDAGPTKAAEQARLPTADCAVATGMNVAADRLERVRLALTSLLERVDL